MQCLHSIGCIVTQTESTAQAPRTNEREAQPWFRSRSRTRAFGVRCCHRNGQPGRSGSCARFGNHVLSPLPAARPPLFFISQASDRRQPGVNQSSASRQPIISQSSNNHQPVVNRSSASRQIVINQTTKHTLSRRERRNADLLAVNGAHRRDWLTSEKRAGMLREFLLYFWSSMSGRRDVSFCAHARGDAQGCCNANGTVCWLRRWVAFPLQLRQVRNLKSATNGNARRTLRSGRFVLNQFLEKHHEALTALQWHLRTSLAVATSRFVDEFPIANGNADWLDFCRKEMVKQAFAECVVW